MEKLFLTFKSQIQTHYASLTKTEQRIADYMMQNPESIMSATSAQIAEIVNVSPASVIRFCKSCGFSGLTELKLVIKKEFNAVNIEKHIGDVQENDSVSLVKQKIMGYHINTVSTVLSGWNEAAYKHAVNEIINANIILVVGYGGSKAMGVCLVDLLLQLGICCEMWEDSSFIALRLGSMGTGDVVIAINYTGRYIDTVHYLKYAKERAITTIGITGVMDSPMIQYTDIVLSAGLKEDSYQFSTLGCRITELVIVEILYSLLASRLDRDAEDHRVENNSLELWRLPREE